MDAKELEAFISPFIKELREMNINLKELTVRTSIIADQLTNGQIVNIATGINGIDRTLQSQIGAHTKVTGDHLVLLHQKAEVISDALVSIANAVRTISNKP